MGHSKYSSNSASNQVSVPVKQKILDDLRDKIDYVVEQVKPLKPCRHDNPFLILYLNTLRLPLSHSIRSETNIQSDKVRKVATKMLVQDILPMIYEFDRYDFDQTDMLVEEFRQNLKFDNTLPGYLMSHSHGPITLN